MLRDVWVTNFRSLENFELTIRPGLNALVGPNGAGKTSIIKWFEFLSLLGTYSLRESIGKIGGANHVFRRKGGKYADQLSFSLKGETKVEHPYYESRATAKSWMVDYELFATISVVKNQIFFSAQSISIWLNTGKNKPRNEKPNVRIDWNYDIILDKFTSAIEVEKPKNIKSDSIESYNFNKKFLEELFNSKYMLETLLGPGQFFPVDFIYAIKSDISYKKAYNVNPSQVRTAIDISSQPGVQFDGSGTVSTIYDIQSKETEKSNRYSVNAIEKNNNKNRFQKLTNYFKLCDSNIDGISVDIESFRNEFVLEVSYTDSESSYSVPVFLLSDGTVKWLALITAISTERQSIFVEEPENFLHPKLQESIVEIIREEVDSSQVERFAIISTHSETLLNKLRPEEIILVSMTDGKTVSERVSDPEEISQIIADSGFGLGYFYVSGGF